MSKAAYISKMLDGNDGSYPEVMEALSLFSLKVLKKVANNGTKIRIVSYYTEYKDHSPALSSYFASVSPLTAVTLSNAKGLFVVAENTIYLKALDKASIVHEFGHALDKALGGETYMSMQNVSFYHLFSNYASNLNYYAASRPDEFFAELIRAYFNLDTIPNLPANRNQLNVKIINILEHILNTGEVPTYLN